MCVREQPRTNKKPVVQKKKTNRFATYMMNNNLFCAVRLLHPQFSALPCAVEEEAGWMGHTPRSLTSGGCDYDR